MEDYTELTRLAERLQQLSRREVTPAKIVGTGYKNPRDVAFEYLATRIMDEICKLREQEPKEYNSEYFKNVRLAHRDMDVQDVNHDTYGTRYYESMRAEAAEEREY